MSTKRKAPSEITAPATAPNVRPPLAVSANEKDAAVSSAVGAQVGLGQNEPIEISSDSDSVVSSDPDDEELDLDDDDMGQQSPAESPQEVSEKPDESLDVNGDHQRDQQVVLADTVPMQDVEEADAATDATDSDIENASTFGELAMGHEVIDVVGALADSSETQGPLLQQGSRSLGAPSISLATALNQALRTDDKQMLESCLTTNDLPTVRNTIERLDSSLAGVLLTSLATRLHRRPGRAGSLMQWVQWTLVAHGGALASQPQALAKLSSLQQVLADRSKGLPSLLILKGKLDLLEAQLQLRKRMGRADPRSMEILQGPNMDEPRRKVIDVNAKAAHSTGAKRKRDDEDESEEEDAVPLTNGIGGDSDDEEDDHEVVDEEDVDDVESLNGDDVDHDDVDESMGEDDANDEDDDSDVEAASLPPTKVQKTTGSFSRGKIQA